MTSPRRERETSDIAKIYLRKLEVVTEEHAKAAEQEATLRQKKAGLVFGLHQAGVRTREIAKAAQISQPRVVQMASEVAKRKAKEEAGS